MNQFDPDNPWILTPPAPAEETTGPQPAPATVASPQPGVPLPAAHLLLPTITVAPAQLWWVGVHGGAGESTLAALYGHADTQHRWPLHQDGSTARVILTARTHHDAVIAARTAITHWASGTLPHIDLIGLVLIADTPTRIPKPLADLIRVVSGGAPRTWNLPYHPSYRIGEHPTLRQLPKPFHHLHEDLTVLTTPGT